MIKKVVAGVALGALIAAGALTGQGKTPGPYQRSYFGTAWRDTDGDGCSQRADVLIRDAEQVTRLGRCGVGSIVLDDPYTGATLTTTADIDIDHVVSLSAAWTAGAWAWTDARRLAFATDLRNLVAVDDRENRRKGDRTPAQWRPPRRAYWCTYAVTYQAVSDRYALTVAPADWLALEQMRTTC